MIKPKNTRRGCSWAAGPNSNPGPNLAAGPKAAGGLTGEDLKNWAARMGFEGNVSAESFQKLLTPQMAGMWKHIVKHVRPKEEVETIRKNILLNQLKKDKMLGKNKGKFTKRINQISQIETLRHYENSANRIEANKAEIKSLTSKCEDLNAELKRMGKVQKETEKKIYDDQTKIALLQEKEAQFRKLLKLKDSIDQVKWLIPQQETKSRIMGRFQPKYSSSPLFQTSNRSILTEAQTADVLDLLHGLDLTIMEEMERTLVSPSEDEERKSKLQMHISNISRNLSSSSLLAGLTVKLQTLNQELVVAATSQNVGEEYSTLKREVELNGGKNPDDQLKDFWKLIAEDKQKLEEIQNSVALKREELIRRKHMLVDSVMKAVRGLPEEDAAEWVDSVVNYSLVTERIKFLEKENDALELQILRSEDSKDLYFEMEHATLEAEHNIKSLLKSLETSLLHLKKNSVMIDIEASKQKIVSKIKSFQKKELAQKWLPDSNNPLLSLKDFIQSEVSLLVRIPVEALQLVCEPQHITKNVPCLPMYTPYTAAHCILRNVLENLCWHNMSISALEELMPSPPIDFNVDHLIESTKSLELNNQLKLEESISEFEEVCNEGEQNIQQATKLILFLKQPPVENFIPESMILDGLNFNSWKPTILEYLKEKLLD
ncbi:unnamed protein product [Bemisia tabaci]|uniref:Uncharacterized protein n=1 Tax=Bemisia tabaci TaxID=7038 RepID=A0A9N9ZZU2_BEMTA|nr:unnamed protein product [Bemisia tabaci]